MMYSILSVILKNIGAFIFYIIIFYYNIMWTMLALGDGWENSRMNQLRIGRSNT